jgi:hypothetical protein
MGESFKESFRKFLHVEFFELLLVTFGVTWSELQIDIRPLQVPVSIRTVKLFEKFSSANGTDRTVLLRELN